ncbi:MAG TPA: DMT family transporter [Hyphomicrobiaceae bacterium]|mgnify:CR=1 FL=1|nr:DMT family transporter [Hyphomicrobiaceae bacterium]
MTSDARTRQSKSDRPLLGIGLTLVAMFAFAVMDGLAKVVSASVAIPQILLIRFAVFGAVVVTLIRWQGQSVRAVAVSARPGLQFVRALLLVVESATFMIAFRMMALADVHAIAAASPLIVVVLSVLVLGDRVGPRRIAAVLVGFLGVLMIVRPGFEKLELPVLVSLFAACLWGGYQIFVRLCGRFDRSETTTLWTALVGLGASSIMGPAVWTWPTPLEWSGLIAIAVLGALAHVTMIKALSVAEPTILQPYSYTLFVWAVVVGYILFGDLPDRWTMAGAAIIIASGLYVWHRERQH